MNRTGNITLVSGTKNIEASYYPFEIKIDVYSGLGKHENKNKKNTAFQITHRIDCYYEQNAYGKKWALEAMQRRWEWFFIGTQEILQILRFADRYLD